MQNIQECLLWRHAQSKSNQYTQKKSLKVSTKQHLVITTIKRKESKNENWKNKSGYNRTVAPCDHRSVETAKK